MAIDCAALGNLVRSDLQQTGPDRRTRRGQTRGGREGGYLASLRLSSNIWALSVLLGWTGCPWADDLVLVRGWKREGYLGRPDPRPLRVTGLGSIAPSPGINHDPEPASQPASQG